MTAGRRPPGPGLVRRALMPLERLFRLTSQSRPIPGVSTFLLSVHPYRGRALTLADGTAVRPGDLVGEIHFWNEHITAGYGSASERELLWRFKRDFEGDLRRLAALDAGGALPRQLVGFFGVTPFARIAGRFGFTHVPLDPTASLRLITRWQRLLGRTFRPSGRQRPVRLVSGACWIGRQDLQRRYGEGSARSS